MIKKILKIVGIVLLAVLAIILIAGLLPVSVPDLPSSPDPVADYDEAVARFETAVSAEEGILMSPKAGSVLMTHGEKTDKAYVLVHGWTNSPYQWLDFAQLLYDRGHNVLIMRMPYHGLTSHDVGELKHAEPEMVRDYADDTIDIAAGLGDEVHVVGLSVGAEVASWIAQDRADVERVMVISPMYGIGKIPAFLSAFLANTTYRLPNINITAPGEEERDHVYQGESTKGVSNAILFGRPIFEQAEERETAVSDIIVVTNANDTTVNNALTDELVKLWQANGTSPETYVFPEELGYPHNSIDPSSNPDADAVYATLLELLGEEPME